MVTVDSAAWAWLQGYNRFVLEYGRNTLDASYGSATLEFPTENITTQPTDSNLVALSSNATHVTVWLQVCM